ncbi:MAG TPA: JAB domain-containing protein [Candidatus Angelobacter sp.]|jgi:DNA repair protein RadC|nr:JAB domain-containing protein [Candidatus Angelobacter sp.]
MSTAIAPSQPARAAAPDVIPALGQLSVAALIALVLDGPEPAAEVLRWSATLARLPFWERRALGAAGLTRDHGVPASQALRLAALWELADRWFPDERPAIGSSRDAVLLFTSLADAHAETVTVLLLDGRYRVLGTEVVAVGGANVARLQPRDVFAPAMRRDASAVVVAHSHPSGDATPSGDDRRMTALLREAASVMGIPLLDHLVVARRRWHSFARSDGWTDTPGWTDDDRDSLY